MTLLFHLAVRLFPPAFRQQFGDDMADYASREYEEARAQSFAMGMLSGAKSAANLLRAALSERWRPTWNNSGTPLPKGSGMRGMFEQWRLDLIYALRALKRSPGFAAVTVITLALAIGASTAMFSVVNTVLINPLPYKNTDRLVNITGTAPGSDLPGDLGVSNEFFIHYRERATSLEDVALYSSGTSTMRADGRVERIRMSFPTYTLFTTLGATPVLGRLPAASDENVALISYTMWKTWFGLDKSVVGKTYSISGSNRVVIGIMGPEFRFPSDGTLVWVPADVRQQDLRPGRFGTNMIARMKPGVTLPQLERELTALSKEMPARFGGSAGYARVMTTQHKAIARLMSDDFLAASSRPLWVLFGAALVVLLIACANVANLFLVRAEGRQREMAVRQAIGAGRAQLLRVQMSEVLVVSAAAGIVAVALAAVTLPLFLRLAPAGVPRLNDAHIDTTTVLFTAGLALVAGLVCGLFPALRGSMPNFSRLRDGNRGSTSGRNWARNALVAAQTALALMLLIGSGLLLRSYSKLNNVNPGYETKGIFTFQIAPEQRALNDGPTYARFHNDFMDRMRAIPGVESVGLIENVPLDEGTASGRFRTERTTGEADSGTLLNYTFSGADYYKTMNIKVLAGRPFTREDSTSALGNAIVSRSAAAQLWPGQDPIGKRVQLNGLDTWETVVGMVEDVMQNDYRERGQSLVYLPQQGQKPDSWRLGSPAYVVKSNHPESIGAEIRSIVREIAPEAPMYRAFTMTALTERSMQDLSFTMLTLGLVSLLALVLGAVGLYGVLSYVVAERTREIGVRMALGAQPGAVRRMVVSQGARVVGVGIIVGLIAALAARNALGSLLFGVQPLDLTTFGGTALTMVLIGLIASYVPARRASNVDPIRSLRGD